MRGKGYVSAVIQSVKPRYSKYRIILNIKAVDPNNNKYEQRIKRKEFYERNGFKDANYSITESDVTYDII